MENKDFIHNLEKDSLEKNKFAKGNFEISMQEKYKSLKQYLSSLEKIAVAFSGGVDSTFLLKAAKEVLGENVIAFTATSAVLAKDEESEAELFCKKEAIKLVKVPFDVFSVDEFKKNTKERCYYCKTKLMQQMKQAVMQYNIQTVVEGTNLDDEKDYRPGMKALTEQGILSPLRTCHLTKEEIRLLSKQLGLPTWNKPSFACLASRIPYGEPVTEELLYKIGEAERFLKEKGFSQLRVRVYPESQLVRLELLPEEQIKFLMGDVQKEVVSYLKELGFLYITLDLEGYRSGSMNRNLNRILEDN